MCVLSLMLAYISIYIFVCICMYLYVFAKGCLFVSLSVCAGGDWGSVVCLSVEGPGCSPDLELQWSMSSAENDKSKPPKAKWPYHEDINLHLDQQQHGQQGSETGY